MPEAAPKTKKDTQKTNHTGLLVLATVFGFSGGLLGNYLFNSTKLTLPQNIETREQLVLQESEVIAGIAERVGPAVVSIRTETSVEGFFAERISEGSGSGIVLTEDGLIVTNKHVISGNVTSLSVILSDGTKYEDVSVVDSDPFNDIAFLQINGASGLTVAELGESDDVRVGEKVIAIGNALGEFDNSVTSGIISGLGRPIIAGGGSDPAESLSNLFQTDAAINPGNSGGPLVNVNGQVIGINTAVADGENIGFAIPIDDVKPSITSVKENGEIIKPYLGVRFVSVDSSIADEFGLSVDSGAYLLAGEDSSVLPGSPADKAGIRDNDVIISVDGVDINNSNPLSSLIGRKNVGDVVELTVVRDEKELSISVTLEAAPNSL